MFQEASLQTNEKEMDMFEENGNWKKNRLLGVLGVVTLLVVIVAATTMTNHPAHEKSGLDLTMKIGNSKTDPSLVSDMDARPPNVLAYSPDMIIGSDAQVSFRSIHYEWANKQNIVGTNAWITIATVTVPKISTIKRYSSYYSVTGKCDSGASHLVTRMLVEGAASRNGGVSSKYGIGETISGNTKYFGNVGQQRWYMAANRELKVRLQYRSPCPSGQIVSSESDWGNSVLVVEEIVD